MNDHICTDMSMMHASPTVLILLTVVYFIFAAQVLIQTDWKKANRPSAIALGSLIVVFVFCGLSGYATSLMPGWFWYVREIMHWVLLAAASTMVFTNQGKVISKLLEH